jgi:tetratricopeptide (TPR) repeat protein
MAASSNRERPSEGRRFGAPAAPCHTGPVTRLAQIAVCLALVLFAWPLAADQTDPRLDALFGELKDAEQATVAQQVEREIWNIWTASDDGAVTLLMRDGVAAMARQDYRGAVRKFDQIVDIAPDFAEGWNKRATVRYLMGDYQGSLADIEKTLALEPRHFGALSGRGLVYIELDKPERALESFEAALEIHPTMPGANHNAMLLRRYLDSREI